ncbi:MAG: hypothetical protein VB061_08410 [Christensenella sp.]|nr:hypothetical protein [Christensenella sp.]
MGDRKSIIRDRPTNAKDEQEEMITIGTILSPMEPINVKQRFHAEYRYDGDGSRDKKTDVDMSVLLEIEKSMHYEHTPKSSREEK